MRRPSRDAARTRRWFLAVVPAACVSSVPCRGQKQDLSPKEGKGQIFPPAFIHYADPLTEFQVSRLTDPGHTSVLPAWYNRAAFRRSNFLLYASDITGRFEAFRMDLKSGESHQLTEAGALDPYSLGLAGNDRTFVCFDGDRLLEVNLTSLRTRELYRMPSGFEKSGPSSLAEDGQYAAVVERKGSQYRLQLIHIGAGRTAAGAIKLAETDDEIADPVIRPRRAALIYRRGNTLWMVNFDGKQNTPLHLAEGDVGQAFWAPDGRSILYLNYPAEARKLHNLREFAPDTKEEKKIADTTQFVVCGSNSDATVFVGASGGKATPHILLLVRSVKRELTLAEHRASDPRMVNPVFSPNSQRVFFVSDRHGKPAVYAMGVEKLVEETESSA